MPKIYHLQNKIFPFLPCFLCAINLTKSISKVIQEPIGEGQANNLWLDMEQQTQSREEQLMNFLCSQSCFVHTADIISQHIFSDTAGAELCKQTKKHFFHILHLSRTPPSQYSPLAGYIYQQRRDHSRDKPYSLYGGTGG